MRAVAVDAARMLSGAIDADRPGRRSAWRCSTPTRGFLQVLAKRLDGAGLAAPRARLARSRSTRWSRCGSTRVVLDLAVLGPQGWTYLEKLCARLPGLGVIVCTGQSSVAQRVRGLRLGADDWVTKPCHPEELIARVEAVVRRRKRAEARVDAGPGRRSARSRSAPTSSRPSSAACRVDLTRREFELIQLLADAEGQVLQREEIYQRVWGYAMVHGDRSVDVFVRKLRQKLERASPRLALHPHPLRHRLPLRGRAGRGRGRRGRAAPVAAPVADASRPAAAGRRRRRPDPRRGYRWRPWALTAQAPPQHRDHPRCSRSSSGSSRAAAPRACTISNILGAHLHRRPAVLRLPDLHGAPRDDLRARGAPARDPLRLARAVALALVATRRMWDERRPRRDRLARAASALAAWGLYTVWRAYREY